MKLAFASLWIAIRAFCGGILDLAGAPVILWPGEHQCGLSGKKIIIEGGPLLARLRIAERGKIYDLYFTRLTGRYNGTGGALTGDCNEDPAQIATHVP
ncbi:MAG: hypothetical protein OXN97_17855 [Bryobacterales bacterium]|nr:hypothetical protein [Bryobacterales bacterium]